MLRRVVKGYFVNGDGDGYWNNHWLESRYGPAPPARFGLYHYAMVWHHAGPFIRIAEPRRPLHISDAPAEWLERVKPVLIPGADFARDRMIQPMQRMPCDCKAEIWIDEALEQVHAVPGKTPDLNPGRVDRLLRQAREHYAYIESLRRRPEGGTPV